ncbi:MAG: quinone oxidoreductase [Fibrobacteres bacterium]|nr:quinone oxidoreductase [Fibrobacterota bacterium]
MKCIDMRGHGGPEVLYLAEAPIPSPGPDEVLIKVHAAGINRPDCLQRQGHYAPPPGASPILGLEVAGTVAACGAGSTRWKPGDAVCALLAGGGYAEYTVAPAIQCLPLPRGFDFIQAAAVPETCFTVWTNLFEDGGLLEGETALIHGGSGGIGTMAIQMAHALGSHVLTTVGRRESEALCRECGADRVFFHKEEDFVQRTLEVTGGRGADVILDMVGGSYLPRNLEALAPLGRLVQIATLGGHKAELDLRKLMQKRLRLTGSTLRPRTVGEKGRIAAALLDRVWPLLESGKVAPKVTRTFPLGSAGEAHALMESGLHTGKLVLEIA